MDSSEVAARRGFYPAGGQGERGDEGERRGDEGRTAGSIPTTSEVQRGPPACLPRGIGQDASGRRAWRGRGDRGGSFFS